MKCVYCNNYAGFMKTYHPECKNGVEAHLSKLESIINSYNQEKIAFQSAKQQLVELASVNVFYQNYLWNSIAVRSNIKTNETLIYLETNFSIAEEKNWKTMERTGLSYARYPTWKVCSRKIEEMATVAFTDKSIYLLGFNNNYIYPYDKIVNIGYEHCMNGTAYFDVKTSSPHPHRFHLWATDGRPNTKGQNITLFLNFLCGWKTT